MSASVLIVDASLENREVLRTVLARRGMTILEAEGAEQGIELARMHHPDVIVLDGDALSPQADTLRQKFAAEAGEDPSRIVVLGKLRRGPVFAGGHVIAKPYHFAAVVHTIERLAAKAA